MVLWPFLTHVGIFFCALEHSKLSRVQQPLSRIMSELCFLTLLQPTSPSIFWFSDIKEKSGTDFFLIQNRLCLGQDSTLHHMPCWAISSSRESTKYWITGCSFSYCCNTEYWHKLHVCFDDKPKILRKDDWRLQYLHKRPVSELWQHPACCAQHHKIVQAEGPQVASLIQPPAQAVRPDQLVQDFIQFGLENLQGQTLHNVSVKTCPIDRLPSWWRCFFLSYMQSEQLFFQFSVFGLLLSHHAPLKSLALCSW